MRAQFRPSVGWLQSFHLHSLVQSSSNKSRYLELLLADVATRLKLLPWGGALNMEIENGRRLLDNPLSGQGLKAAR